MTRIVVGLVAMVVIMVAIPILLAWSQSRRRLRVEARDGAAVLRMPRGHWGLLALIAVLPFGTMSVTAFLVQWQPGAESSGLVLGAVLGATALLAGGYLLGLEFRGCIRLDEAAIEKVGTVGRRAFAWSEVARITFNPVNNWFFLVGPGGKTIYFGEGLDGIGTFADYALRKLPPRVLEASPEAEEALQELARG